MGAVVAVAVLVIWVYPCRDDFRVANAAWNGASEYCSRSGATAIDSLSDLPPEPSGTALILIPYTSFSDEELDELEGYVQGGGTLILMDDYGYGSEVLRGLDVEYSFSGEPLLDPLINYKNEQFPKIMDFNKDSPLTQGVDAIVFDHATCLRGDFSKSKVIATSSGFSFLDINGNSLYDEDVDERGPLPVAASTQLVEGRLIAISDPSIMINGMLGMEGNYTLLQNAAMVDAEELQVFLDQSHLPLSSLSKVKLGLGGARGVLGHPMVVVGIVGGILALTWRPLWRASKGRL
jgi:hypothetical protein